MILVDSDIRDWLNFGVVQDYLDECINPASIDLRLSGEYRSMDGGDPFYAEELTLHPRTLYTDVVNFIAKIFPFVRPMHTAVLASTYERLWLRSDLAAEVKMKTTPCREGLGHPTADWVDPGFEGQLTLMLHAVRKITIRRHQRICQLVIHKLSKCASEPYYVKGHYNKQFGPTRSWREWDAGKE